MKRIKTTITALFALIVVIGCTDLEEEQFSQLRLEEFPTADAPVTFQLTALEPISAFRSFVGNQRWWLMLEGGTDECFIPSRGGGWVDGNRWRDLHQHTWPVTHPTLNNMWQFAYQGIEICNSGLSIFEAVPDSDEKTLYGAQIRAMRALYHFLLMDAFGNVPISTDFTDTDLPQQNTRAEVYEFVTSELLAIVDDLESEVTDANYGLPTKWFAHFLLAKTYLNSQVYAGKDDSAAALAQLDIIIDSGNFGLNPNFLDIFAPNNGPGEPESIWAMVNDANFGSQMNFQIRFLPGGAGQAFGVDAGGWGGHATLPEFYELFDDPTDQRNDQWLAGPISDTQGNPVMNGDFQMNLINEFTFGVFDASNSYDVGGDTFTGEGKIQGVRSVKYTPDPNHGNNQAMNNDYQMFRYADVILMKAEVLLNNGDAAGALDLVNEVRAARSATPRAALTSEDLLEERGLEFAFEHWRRNDMIRFGTWEDPFLVKTDSDPAKRLFPIPQNQLDINPNLQQNPGY